MNAEAEGGGEGEGEGKGEGVCGHSESSWPATRARRATRGQEEEEERVSSNRGYGGARLNRARAL